MGDAHEHVDKLMQELRRGTIAMGALSQLYNPQYGYSLVTTLNEMGIQVEGGTLYPLLRRLEKQGYLESTWDTNDPRPRKYYVLSKTGKEALDLLNEEWEEIVTSMSQLMKRRNEDGND